jgi:anhydro-N-acetylmuramic acid kinase
VGNVTWVDPTVTAPELACLAFDTGPANAPINDLMHSRLGKAQDLNGEMASQGTADQTLIARFLDHSYFYRMPPKSLDRNDFHGILDVVSALSNADAARTLTAFAALAVASGTDHFPKPVQRMLVGGGGRLNPVLMDELRANLPGVTVEPVEAAGLDGDMLEAQAFAYLAVRVARGLPTSCPRTTGVAAAIGGGKISKP